MNIPFLISSGMIVLILYLVGIIYTYREFQEMTDHPEDYRRKKTHDPEVIDQG